MDTTANMIMTCDAATFFTVNGAELRRHIAWRRVTACDIDDVVSDCLVRLTVSLPRYSPDRGDWLCYVRRIIDNAVNSYFTCKRPSTVELTDAPVQESILRERLNDLISFVKRHKTLREGTKELVLQEIKARLTDQPRNESIRSTYNLILTSFAEFGQ